VSASAIFDVNSLGSFELFSGQTLKGGGTVSGPVTVDSGATVAPGDFASTGTLTFTNAPVLNGAVVMRLSKGSVPANDQLAVASSDTLNYNGTLTITNVGSAPVPGDKFYLFSAAAYSGGFGSITYPTLPAGQGWTNNLLNDGSITVTGAVVVATPPKFTSVVFSNGSLIISGTNGANSGTYTVVTSTNLLSPLTSWKAIATNTFNSGGGFSFTNVVSMTNSASFFDIWY
jgi:hypothetical protein